MRSARSDTAALLDDGAGTGLPVLSDGLVDLLDLPAELPERMPIASVAELTGITAHTLRYWERIGLMTVCRDHAGNRVYDRDTLAQVMFVIRLRLSEMPVDVIRRYVALVGAGEHTTPQRLELMNAHRATVQRRVQELEDALALIDYKIAAYDRPRT